MTDITDPQAEFLTAFARGVASRPGSYSDDLVDSARAVLATVDAPEPTLAEEVKKGLLFRVNDTDAEGIKDALDLAARVEQIEQERDQARAEVERLTTERDDRPAADLPNPADVKPGEAWIVNIDGVEIVPGFKASVGWICYRFFGGTTKAIGDDRITLVSRLVPAPRQATTLEDLHRLPEDTVVRNIDGEVGVKGTEGRWYLPSVTGPYTAGVFTLPVTVLWEPEVAA